MKRSRFVFYSLLLLCHTSASDFNTTTANPATTNNNITEPVSNKTGRGSTNLNPEVTYILVGIYAVVFIVGVTGNVLVLQTVATKRMRTVKNVLIGNLALADLITCVICLPMTVTRLFIPWPFGTFICKVFFPLSDVFVSVSILTLCTITLDRFRAIVHPFTRKMSMSVTALVTLGIWLVSFVIVAVPLINMMSLKKGSAGLLVCTPRWPSNTYRQAYRLAILLILYVIPVCLIFFCFVCIGRKIKQNMRFTRESVRDTRSLARLQRRSRVVKLMFVIFITFTLCLLPIHFLLTITVFYKQALRWPGITNTYHSCILILLANSCMNPIILCLMSSDFKRGFKSNCLCLLMINKIKSSRDRNQSLHSNDIHTGACITAMQHFQDSFNKKHTDTNKDDNSYIPMLKLRQKNGHTENDGLIQK